MPVSEHNKENFNEFCCIVRTQIKLLLHAAPGLITINALLLFLLSGPELHIYELQPCSCIEDYKEYLARLTD